MSLTSFVVSRNWASNRLRTLLTLLGIGAGIAIVVAIYVMDHNTIQSRMVRQDQLRGPVDLEVTPIDGKRDLAAVRADLGARAGVTAVATWRETVAALVAGKETLEVAVFGLDPLPGGGFAHYAVANGQDLSAADGEGAVLLGGEAARLLQVKVGDPISVRERASGQRVECRDGKLTVLPASAGREPFATTVKVAGVLTEDRIGRRNFGMVAVVPHALARRLPAVGPDRFQVQRAYGADLDRLRTELSEQYAVADLRAAMLGEGADERAFRNGLKVLGCLALLLGMFVVFQTLSHSLLARVRTLGLLRCLGAGRGAVVRIFLFDALALGVVGSLLGIAGGLVLALLLKHWQVSSLGLGKEWATFEVPLLPVAWTACLGVVFTLAGAAFPLWRARQLPALRILQARGLGDGKDGGDLLRGVHVWLFVLLVLVLPLAYLAMTPLVSEEGRETLGVLLEMGAVVALFGGLLLLAPVLVGWLGGLVLRPVGWLAPLATWLCRKTIARNPGRIAAAVCGLSAVLLALLGLKTLTASLRAEVHAFAAEALEARAFVQMPAITPAAANVLATVPGVRAVEIIEGTVSDAFVLRGLAGAALAAPGGALAEDAGLQRRYLDPQLRGMVVSQRLASKMGWKRGSVVALRDRNRAPVAYEVLAVSDRSGYVPSERAWAVAAPHWLRGDFCIGDACVEHVVLRLADDASAAAVMDRCQAALPMIHGKRPGYWFRDYHLRDVDRDFVLFDVLLLLMLLLAGVGLLNGMTIAALGRMRELGVLRALGVGRRTLHVGFLCEGAVVGLLAAGLAVGLCWPMAQILITGLNRVARLEAPVALPEPWLWAVPGIALVTGVLAAVVPARQAVRAEPAESVRYE